MTELFRLTGKRILLTGAAGHIGQTLVKALYKAGAEVWGLDRVAQPESLNEFLAGYIRAELGDKQQLTKSVTDKLSAIGTLHGFVHCAAFVGTSDLTGWLGDLTEQSRETFDQAMQVNLGSAFSLVKVLSPLFEKPSIVFMSSIYGEIAPDFSLYEGTAMDNPAAYGASKAGLQQFSKYIASRHGEDGWRSNTITLGGVSRGQPQVFVDRYNAKVPLQRMASEDDVVGPVLFLLSDASSYISGAELPVDGGYLIR